MCDVIWEGRVKNPLKPRVVLCRLPKITRDRRRAGRNEIISRVRSPHEGRKGKFIRKERNLNGLLFGTLFDGRPTE